MSKRPIIKIYKMSDTDWVAAKNIKDAILCLCQTLGCRDEDELKENDWLDDPREISSKEMDHLIYADEDGDSNRTFREELNRRISVDEKFPQHFAGSE